jgi:hypothetical protein
MAIRTKKQSSEIPHSASIEHLEYNTQRADLLIAEYGRNVQKMVEQAMAIEDREKRTKTAQSIVNVMALLNPSVRDLVDYKHKLWDHLFIISDFKLDVDSPFEKPLEAKIKSKPQRIAYPDSDIHYKYYGKIMEDMIRKISEMEDSPRKEKITQNLANFMKMSYLTWNKDTVDDSTILHHIQELSKGLITVDESVKLNHTAEILALSKEKQRENSGRTKNRPNMNNKNKRRKK